MSKKKRLNKLFSIILLSFLGFTFFLPTFLSTSTGNQLLLSFINSYIPGRLTAKNISLSWLEKQKVEQLQLFDPSGAKLVSAETVNIDKSLLTTFWNLHKGQETLDAIKGSGSLNIKNLQLSHESVAYLATKIQGIEIFGVPLNIDLNLRLQGSKKNIWASVSGALGNLTLNGIFDDSFFFLTEPLILTTTASPELQKIFAKSIPLFEQMIPSKEQIKLTVFPENFVLPVKDASIAEIQIGKISLDAGKLAFRNKGSVKELVSNLLPSHADTITVWTTPLYAALEEGVVTLKRTDMLILNQYPIAIWGSADLIKDQLHMTLGLSTKAIAKVFNIKNSNNKTLVQIPIKGSLANIKIDHLKAATKIGALIAQNNDRPEALLIGSVLELFSGKEEKTPKPTTSPLPWEKKSS